MNKNASSNWWWSLSPDRFDGSSAYVWFMSWGGYLDANGIITSAGGLRPAVSIVSTTTITGGDGTSDNPYVVQS